LRPPDFESGASASSATPGQHLKISRRRPTLKKLWSAAALLPLSFNKSHYSLFIESHLFDTPRSQGAGTFTDAIPAAVAA
jgi:hypothetical protein